MKKSEEAGLNRRSFVKGALYVTPVILTLAAKPAFAQLGSARPGRPTEPNPPQTPRRNDDPGNHGNEGRGRRVDWSDSFGGQGGGSNGRGRGSDNRGGSRRGNR